MRVTYNIYQIWWKHDLVEGWPQIWISSFKTAALLRLLIHLGREGKCRETDEGKHKKLMNY